VAGIANREEKATGHLARDLGLLGLAATGICSMLGAAINVIPIMLQRNVPGIGPYVLPAYFIGAVPAILAALAYAVLSSAMPRAGGSYVYASRAIHPYVGFIASFSQWFGLCIAIGVVSYVLVPFLRDIALALGATGVAEGLLVGPVRVAVSLAFLWTFVGINLLGVKSYERTLVPLMFLMFAAGAVVIITGAMFDQADFTAAVAQRDGVAIPTPPPVPLDFGKILAGSAILFSSFIGFDSIAQAGGEAKRPGRNLPLAIGIAVVTVGAFYMLFTAAVYRVVPWNYIAERALTEDLTAPGPLGYVLSPGWTVVIVAGAAIALINDLPAMLLAVSRLMIAWAEDGIFPRKIAAVNRRWNTPHVALVLSGLMASAGILGSHLAGDFFLGVDLLATSMLVNFFVMCVAVLTLPRKNPTLAAEIRFLEAAAPRTLVGIAGAVCLGGFLTIHVVKDLSSDVAAWYFHSTPIWILVMVLASVVFWREWRTLRRRGVDVESAFDTLPAE
jgi:APA family basic amino acid/polyamine antiporter